MNRRSYEMRFNRKLNILKLVNQIEENMNELEAVIESLEPGMLIEDHMRLLDAMRKIEGSIYVLKVHINHNF